MENKDVWRLSSWSFCSSLCLLGLGSIMSGAGAVSSHNLVPCDGVIGVQWVYFTNLSGFQLCKKV